MALTDRQKQIKDLQREGLSPPQIAERLEVSPNAIYQQLSRMRQSGASKSAKGKTKAKANSTPGKGSARRTAAPKPASAPKPAPAPRTLTPLQAIRERRTEIEHALKETADALAAAERALVKTREAHEGASAKFAEELAHLDGAEAVLKGEAVAKTPSAPRPENARSGGSKRSGAKADKPKGDTASTNGDSAQSQTTVPSSQEEREAAQAEFDRTIPPVASEPEAQPEPATEPAPATA